VSFFVSDSLKGIITEEDLMASSPISIKEKHIPVLLNFKSDKSFFTFKLIKINFEKNITEINIRTDNSRLNKILSLQHKIVDYSISINDSEHMLNSGTLKIRSLEVNNEDNYITCKIDIIK
jgi:hypothetical protein|tara:strand:+ start:6612 stop:6974 length:363 start_codon:yes stop_codon:yes gene_type:complete